MINGDQQRITQHKRFVLYSTHPNFCFAKTSFMLGTLWASLRNDTADTDRPENHQRNTLTVLDRHL